MNILDILKYVFIAVASVIALIMLITAVFVVVRLIKGERFKFGRLVYCSNFAKLIFSEIRSITLLQ